MYYTVSEKEGRRQFEWQNDSITVRLTGEDTGGAFTLIEDSLKPTFNLPMHLHKQHTETFYILEGKVEFTISGEITVATPGMTVHIPQRVPHAVRTLDNAPARMLMWYTPAGFERFLEKMSTLSEEHFTDQKFMTQLEEEFDNFKA